MDTVAVVIDNGSGMMKAGFSNNPNPLCVFSSVLGRPRSSSNSSVLNESNVIFGSEAFRKRGLLSLRYPIEHGIIVNWDDMERLWNHTLYDQLRINPSDHSIMLTEATLNPKSHREKTTQIMFEKFNVPSMYIGVQSNLALYSSGRTIGLVLESGEGVTHACPIYEGYALPQAILRLDLGGRDVTDYMVKLLSESGHQFLTAAEREVVREMKEKTCFIALDYEHEINNIEINSKSANVSYELPDGNSIHLGSIRCKSPEILFKPKMIGNDQYGLSQLIFESIMKCEVDIRRTFFNNIVLIGGNTMFEGMQQRLYNEINEKTPNSVKTRIVAEKNRKYAVWIGAAIISDLMSFRKNWMTKKEFEENGISRIHQIIV